MTAFVSNYLEQTHAAFRFVIKIGDEAVAAFTECTLPTLEIDVEDLKEGGLNNYIHQMPGQRKQGRLSFKNGIGKSSLSDWCHSVILGADFIKDRFATKKITVELRDATYERQIVVWNMDAFPIKWTGPQLQTDSTTVAIQTVEFACTNVDVVLS